jgi:PAS domain S-box-containing protein
MKKVTSLSDFYKAIITEDAEELYDHAPCGYLSTLANGLIVKVNKTFLDWTGFGLDEVLYKRKLQDFFSVGGKVYYEKQHAPLIKEQGYVKEQRYDMVTESGQVFPVLVNEIQIKEKDGVPIINKVTVFNVTEIKQHEKELLKAREKAQQAEEVKSGFLSKISQEISEPVQVIAGIIDLLKETSLSEKQKEYLEILSASSQTLAKMMENVQEMQELGSDKVMLEEKSFSLKALVLGLSHLMRIKSQEKGLRLITYYDDLVPANLIGDLVKTNQVLIYLIRRAISNIQQGSVELRILYKGGDYQNVEVGFEVECVQAENKAESPIVDNEFAAREATAQKPYEDGLGLAVCKQLLERMGAKMNVMSEKGKREKVCFDLSFRLEQGKSEYKTWQPNEGSIEIRGIKVLIAEDNPFNIFLLTEYFQNWGVSYEVVKNGALAVEQVQRGMFDLVLMDIQMPGLDGYAATKMIRELKEDRFKEIPIIALSASGKNELEKKMMTAGINDCIGKPIKAYELYTKLLQYTTGISDEHEDGMLLDEEVVLVLPQSSLLHFEGFAEMTNYKKGRFCKLLSITIRTFEEEKVFIQKAFDQKDHYAFAQIKHKLNMPIQLLKAVYLEKAMFQAQQVLGLENTAMPMMDSAGMEMNKAFDEVVAEMQKALKLVQ